MHMIDMGLFPKKRKRINNFSIYMSFLRKYQGNMHGRWSSQLPEHSKHLCLATLKLTSLKAWLDSEVAKNLSFTDDVLCWLLYSTLTLLR